MNKEILFRAKTTKKDNPINAFNNVWVEGDLIRSDGKYYIHPIANKVKIDGELGKIIIMHEINSDTTCQYTGRTDKNGNKIFENDIVKKIDCNALGWHRERICRVLWDNDGFWLLTTHGDGYSLCEFNDEQLEVVGNIFDNADLLEVE